MSSSISKSAFRQGVLVTLPFLLLVVPFGMLYGVLASEAGLSFLQVIGFSLFDPDAGKELPGTGKD